MKQLSKCSAERVFYQAVTELLTQCDGAFKALTEKPGTRNQKHSHFSLSGISSPKILHVGPFGSISQMPLKKKLLSVKSIWRPRQQQDCSCDLVKRERAERRAALHINSSKKTRSSPPSSTISRLNREEILWGWVQTSDCTSAQEGCRNVQRGLRSALIRLVRSTRLFERI